MTFPEKRFAEASKYCAAYLAALRSAGDSIDPELVSRAAQVLRTAYEKGRTVYTCGNGGSASIANHLVCDHLKGIQTDTDLRPRVSSMSDNIELITAIANDIGYEDVFVYQLRTVARPKDVLISISSSGDSENVVRALEWARGNEIRTIALTGFSGGRARKIAELNLHVEADNYGIVEDVHQSIMHILAQYLRQRGMTDELIGQRKF